MLLEFTKSLDSITTNLMHKNGTEVEDSEDSTLKLDGLQGSKIHTVMLESKKLSLSVKCTEKTTIEVS